MSKYLIFISAADGVGETYSDVYISDTEVNDELIEACKKHLVSLYASVGYFYLERGSVIVVPVSNAEGNLTNAQECLTAFRKSKKEKEELEISMLKELKEKYPDIVS